MNLIVQSSEFLHEVEILYSQQVVDINLTDWLVWLLFPRKCIYWFICYLSLSPISLHLYRLCLSVYFYLSIVHAFVEFQEQLFIWKRWLPERGMDYNKSFTPELLCITKACTWIIEIFSLRWLRTLTVGCITYGGWGIHEVLWTYASNSIY